MSGTAPRLFAGKGLNGRQASSRSDLGRQSIQGQGFRRDLTPVFRHAAKITTAAIGDFYRPQHAFNIRVARAAMQAVTVSTQPPRDFRDPLAAGRAQAAFDEVWSRLQAAIDATTRNASLSPEQRVAAIRALRERQAAEAGAARKRIMDEETAAAKQRQQQARTERKPRQ